MFLMDFLFLFFCCRYFNANNSGSYGPIDLKFCMENLRKSSNRFHFGGHLGFKMAAMVAHYRKACADSNWRKKAPIVAKFCVRIVWATKRNPIVFGPDRIKHGRLAAILILQKMSTSSNRFDFVCSRAVFRGESNGAIET